jgi:hypothetical protein
MTGLGVATGVAVAVVLLLGGGVTAAAFRASRRTGSRALGSLTVGIGVVTGAAAVGAGLHHLFGVSFARALLAQTLSTALGFAALAASLYLEPRVTTGRLGSGDGPDRGGPGRNGRSG